MKKILRYLFKRLGDEKINLCLGKAWMSVDRYGIVAWGGAKNYYYFWYNPYTEK